MKIIDLLNKIANGEKEDIFKKYHFSNSDYCNIDAFFTRYIIDEENLNLEIIEDTPKDKKINMVERKARNLTNQYIKDKLNEIIKKVNKL